MRAVWYFVAIVILVFAKPALPASLKSGALKDGRIILTIAGEISEGDVEAFKTAVKTANASGKFVGSVRLNSIGGNLLEGVKLAQAVKFAKIAVNVGQDAVCASACFLIFAAGEMKYANYTAKIGVHGASDKSGGEAGDATVSMARVAKDLGVPSSIIGRLVVTPPTEMVWLSPTDLQSMGTTMVGKPAQVSTNETSSSPHQIQNEDPVGLAQSQKAKAVPSFEDFTKMAISLSSQQNNGKPTMLRNCEVKHKVCWNVVVFKDKNGNDNSLKVTRDMNEQIVKRELCEFNSSGDIRKCYDWDANTTVRSMKDIDGGWYRIDD